MCRQNLRKRGDDKTLQINAHDRPAMAHGCYSVDHSHHVLPSVVEVVFIVHFRFSLDNEILIVFKPISAIIKILNNFRTTKENVPR
jgi:hypothetical protein